MSILERDLFAVVEGICTLVDYGEDVVEGGYNVIWFLFYARRDTGTYIYKQYRDGSR